MGSSTFGEDRRCDETRELIAWYPTRALDPLERRTVEEHAAGCAECTELLRFVSDVKATLLKKSADHPEAEALVCYVEDKDSLGLEERSAVREHLEVCPQCAEQAAILEEVEKTVSVRPGARAPSDARVGVPGIRWRDSLRAVFGGLLKPVPAAVYLVVAVAVTGLLVFRPGPGSDTGVADGVVILPDETDRVRDAGAAEIATTTISAGESQFLLLELTGLEAPPTPNAIYTVEIVEEESGATAFGTSVEGRSFADNYTIYLRLPGGTLPRGMYSVEVLAPDRSVVYRSRLEVN